MNIREALSSRLLEDNFYDFTRAESLFAFTDQRIHAFESRNNYQKIVMRSLDWCRAQQDLRDPAQIYAQADELACLYFTERIAQNYSAWTLTTEW